MRELRTISDDNMCAKCVHLDYRPGVDAPCDYGWPGEFDKEGNCTYCSCFGLAVRFRSQERWETAAYPGPEIKGIVRILHDNDPCFSPREDEPLTTMVFWHREYRLGDEHAWAPPPEFQKELAVSLDETAEHRIDYWENGNGWTQLSRLHKTDTWKYADEKITEIVNKVLEKHVIILPLFLYDHGNLTLRSGSFGDFWNEHADGFVFITKEHARREWGWKTLTKSRIKRIEGCLEADAEVYDQYISGEVFRFVVEDLDGEHVDSCWGFYGSDLNKNGIMDLISCYLKEGFALGDIEW